MRAAILLTAILLAACGSKTAGPGRDGTGTDTKPNLTIAAGTADCAQKPDFVPVYEGATIAACVSNHTGTGKIGGNLTYDVSAPAARIINWSKQQAVKAGLKPVLQTETMLSAEQGTSRTLVVVVSNDGSGSQVVVNWGVRK